jgi:hypothetical protein
MTGGISQLNQVNLGGLDNRKSLGGGAPSDIGSLYKGANMDDDALSHFMGASDYGGGNEIGIMPTIGYNHGNTIASNVSGAPFNL